MNALYRRRTESVTAVQWTGDNLAAMPLGSFRHPEYDDVLVVPHRSAQPTVLTFMVPPLFWVISERDGMNAARSERDFAEHYEVAE